MKKVENEEKRLGRGEKRKMFKSMKMSLRNKLDDSEEVSRIRNKIFSFLKQNPDVDHFLSDEISKKVSSGFFIGLLLGVLILVFGFALFYLQIDIWHSQGFIHIPGTIWS